MNKYESLMRWAAAHPAELAKAEKLMKLTIRAQQTWGARLTELWAAGAVMLQYDVAREVGIIIPQNPAELDSPYYLVRCNHADALKIGGISQTEGTHEPLWRVPSHTKRLAKWAEENGEKMPFDVGTILQIVADYPRNQGEAVETAYKYWCAGYTWENALKKDSNKFWEAADVPAEGLSIKTCNGRLAVLQSCNAAIESLNLI